MVSRTGPLCLPNGRRVVPDRLLELQDVRDHQPQQPETGLSGNDGAADRPQPSVVPFLSYGFPYELAMVPYCEAELSLGSGSFSEGYRPIVQVIDNIERNHKLGLIFELAVGKGKLPVCMSDLEAADDKPEVRQLYRSMLDYMASGDFNPKTAVSSGELVRLLRMRPEETKRKS